MTIIAYRAGVLAADSLITDRGCRVGTTDKIRRINGYITGSCGSLGKQASFFAWAEAGMLHAEKPKFEEDDFEALVIDRDGGIIWYGKDLVPTKITCEYTAIGSGFRIAMGALAMGADAIKAVHIVCDLDVDCGRPVTSLRLSGGEDHPG